MFFKLRQKNDRLGRVLSVWQFEWICRLDSHGIRVFITVGSITTIRDHTLFGLSIRSVRAWMKCTASPSIIASRYIWSSLNRLTLNSDEAANHHLLGSIASKNESLLRTGNYKPQRKMTKSHRPNRKFYIPNTQIHGNISEEFKIKSGLHSVIDFSARSQWRSPWLVILEGFYSRCQLSLKWLQKN